MRALSPSRRPLQVTLIELDRDVYRLFDQFWYRITVRNTGREAIPFPRERQLALGTEMGNTRPVTCFLELLVKAADGTGKIRHTPGLRLTGAVRQPDSVVILKPGESVELVVPGKWDFTSQAARGQVAASLPRRVTVSAALSFLEQPKNGHAYDRAISVNSMVMTLEEAVTMEPKP